MTPQLMILLGLFIGSIPSYKSLTKPILTVVNPELIRAKYTSYEFVGFLDEYLTAISNNWLKGIVQRNPNMLGMFFNVNRENRNRKLVSWYGEYPGKYLVAAVQVLRLTKDIALERYLGDFVNDMEKIQDDDGYLGPWPRGCYLTGKAPNEYGGGLSRTWDAWGHYHIMLGLLLWHGDTEDNKALAAAGKIGDLLCDKFFCRPGSFAGIGEHDKNLAPIHSLCLLYKQTGMQRYLALAQQICTDEFPVYSKWVETSKAGKEFHQSPTPRWEGLHSIMGLAELYWLTGNEIKIEIRYVTSLLGRGPALPRQRKAV